MNVSVAWEKQWSTWKHENIQVFLPWNTNVISHKPFWNSKYVGNWKYEGKMWGTNFLWIRSSPLRCFLGQLSTRLNCSKFLPRATSPFPLCILLLQVQLPMHTHWQFATHAFFSSFEGKILQLLPKLFMQDEKEYLAQMGGECERKDFYSQTNLKYCVMFMHRTKTT